MDVPLADRVLEGVACAINARVNAVGFIPGVRRELRMKRATRQTADQVPGIRFFDRPILEKITPHLPSSGLITRADHGQSLRHFYACIVAPQIASHRLANSPF